MGAAIAMPRVRLLGSMKQLARPFRFRELCAKRDGTDTSSHLGDAVHYPQIVGLGFAIILLTSITAPRSARD
jgi:hypothetical protein